MKGGEPLENNANEQIKEAKKPFRFGIVITAALAACCIWLAAVGTMLILKLNEPQLPATVLDYTFELSPDIPPEPEPEPEESEPQVLGEYKSLYEQNNDMVGWLKIDGTMVDYPVMQCKGFDPTVQPIDYSLVYEKNMYYLKHDFNKEYSYSGSITAEYCAHIDSDYRSPNIILYGHNMSNGTFFRDVNKYDVLYYGREMYDNHPVIQFDTIYEKGIYKIFAMMQVNVYPEDGDVFYYTATYDFDSKQEFIDYYAQVLDRSYIYTPQVDIKYGDEIIALSTCDFPFGKSKIMRFVVFARRVRPGEDPTVDVSQTIINPDPLYYDYWYSVYGGSWGGRNWDPALLKGYEPKESNS